MSSLLFTCNAVLPIILCIVVGYAIKHLKLFPDDFWSKLNKLCFRVLLPVLLFKNIYDIESISKLGEQWKVLIFGAIAIAVVFFIGLLVVIFSVKDSKQKGVVLQCIFRSNFAIIGIGLIELLATGDIATEAKGVGAVLSAISIPLFNILAIISLSIFVKNEDGSKISPKEIFIKICKNPLIIGVLTGILFLIIRLAIPTTNINGVEIAKFTIRYFNKPGDKDTFIYTTIKWLAQASSPVALIALGGGFTFSAVARLKWQIILGTAFRILIVPVVCLSVGYLLGFRSLEFPALIALFGTPVAVSSAPMSAEMDNDAELAGQLVVWTSLMSIFTLFGIIFTCSMIGIF